MTRRRSKNRKWIIGGVVFVVLVAIGIGVVLVWNGGQKDSEDSSVSVAGTEKETEKTVKSTDDTADNGKSEDEMEEEMMRDKNVVQYEGDNPNKADSLFGVITYAGVNDGKLVIRVNIDQYLSGGKCELSLVRNSSSIYNDTADIVASASTATCEGFDVPVSGIGGGSVEINVKLSADGRNGLIRGEANI